MSQSFQNHTSFQLIIGQKFLAIGNPFGVDRTLTTGVISGLGRMIHARNGWAIEGVQTDASIRLHTPSYTSQDVFGD